MSTKMKVLVVLSLCLNFLTTIYLSNLYVIRDKYENDSQVDIERLAKDLTSKKAEQQKLIEAFYDLERSFKANLQNLFIQNKYVTVIYNSEWDRINIIFSNLEPKEKIEEETRWLYWPKYYLNYTISDRSYYFFYHGFEYSTDFGSGSGWPKNWNKGWIKTTEAWGGKYWKKYNHTPN